MEDSHCRTSRETWAEEGDREGEKTQTETHSHTGRDRKASDRSGHYGWEACWELGRTASDPQDADTASDRKPGSGYGFAWSSADLGTEADTLPPFTDTHLWCEGYTPSLPLSHTHTLTHTQEAQKAPVAGWRLIFKEGLYRDNTPSDATVCSRTHTYADDDNG